MFGGYAEVLQFNYDSESKQNQDDYNGYEPMPDMYLPKYETVDPWVRPSLCSEDFILIAEFSEQEGPKPLIKIPEDAGKDFDVNNFAVRILSVDYQIIASEGFSAQEDNQIILSDSSKKVHAYVHYFTLYDFNARGFVRPFCMSYVTSDYRKLISFYDEISQEFDKVSQIFKYGNLRLFQQDMTHYHSDLQFTKVRYIERQQELQNETLSRSMHFKTEAMDFEDKLFKTMNLKTLANCMTELRNILDKATDLMFKTDKRYEEYCKPSAIETSRSRHQSSSQMTQSMLSSSLIIDSPLECIRKQDRQRSASLSEIDRIASVTSHTEYKPKLVRTINRRKFDKALRSIHELCYWGTKEAIKALESIYKTHSTDLACLELERNDKNLICPNSGLILLGRTVVSNFLSNTNILSTNTLPLTGLYQSETCLSSDTVGSFMSAKSHFSDEEEFAANTSTVRAECDSTASGTNIGKIQENSQSQPSTSKLTEEVSSSSLACQNAYHDVHLCDVNFVTSHIKDFCSTSAGWGIMRVMQYSFAVHLIYPLLIGRLLIITASKKMEKDLEAVLTALRLFIPGHSQSWNSIMSFPEEPIHSAELQHLKLVGFYKPSKKLLKDLLEDYDSQAVSIFDMEKKLLSSPKYQGSFIKTVHSKRKHFKMEKEKAYVGFILSAFTELVTKAQHYWYSVANHGFDEELFFSKIKTLESDRIIIKYLSDLIKRKVAEAHGQEPDFSCDVTPEGTLKSSIFKN